MPGINGFDRLHPQEQAKHGWFPFTAGSEPEHDPNTQKVVWRVAFGPVVTSYATVEPLTDTEIAANLEARRKALLERNAELRWLREVGGIDFYGYPEREAPIPIHTDRDSQITIFAAALRGQDEMWKGRDGNWYPLSAQDLALLSESIAQHKRICFETEAKFASMIRGCETFSDLDEIALEASWSPSE
jgi:hypothetical protein